MVPGLASFEEPKFPTASGSLIPEDPLPKKQKVKKVAKAKEIICLDFKTLATLKDKSNLNVLAKNFAYPQFMDNELMTLTCLEQLHRNEDNLVEKFQWAGRMLLKLAAI